MNTTRRIAALIYRNNARWEQSVQLSKGDKMYSDAIDTANASASSDIVEKLLKSFCELGEKEAFGAALYTCFELVSPDVALELGWRNGYSDFVMPFFIQSFKKTHDRIAELERKVSPPQEEVDKAKQAEAYGTQGSGLFNQHLMIGNGACNGDYGLGVPYPQQSMNAAYGGLSPTGFSPTGQQVQMMGLQ